MNVNRRNNDGWILCPSKSIPGKFYYFNVVTGEAVWSLSDTETKFDKKGNNIDRVADRTHNYHEPVSPPKEYRTTNINFHKNRYLSEPHQLQSFGNAIFPKYITNIEPQFSNIVWTPLQLPMFVTNVSKPTLDQITQTSELDASILVQTCPITLSQRFTSFRNIDCIPDKHLPSKPKKNWWNNTDKYNSNEIKNDEVPSEFNFKRKLDEPKLILKESKLKRLKTTQNDDGYQMNSSSSKYYTGNASLNQGQKVENVTSGIENVDSLEKLDKTDLRFVLQSKKHKTDTGVINETRNQSKIENNIKVTPKKRVTFKINNNGNSTYIINNENDANNETENSPIPINLLKPFNLMDCEWYICVDENVLLEELDFILDYIAGDDFCKLLIPDSMVRYVESLGMGEHDGRGRVLAARRVHRTLVASERVEIIDTDDGTSLLDNIIKCCLKIMNMNLHVVLITKSQTLEEEANLYSIQVYNVDDIKNGITDTNKTCPPNNEKNNLFLQKDFDPMTLSKIIKPIALRRTIYNFDKENDYHNYHHENSFETTHDSTTIANSTDFCRDIERLNINDMKSIDIRKVINNSKVDRTIENRIDDDIDKNAPFRTIFDHIKENHSLESNVSKSQFFSERNYKNEYDNQKDDVRIVLERDFRKPFSSTNATDIHERFDEEKSQINNYSEKELKLNSNYSIRANLADDKLGSFHINDGLVANNIVTRWEGWICTYVQIMEEFLHVVLQNDPKTKNQVPHFLNEGLVRLKRVYSDSQEIRTTLQELLQLCERCLNKGAIKKDKKPNDFMKMLECAFLLVELFENVVKEDFSDTRELLVELVDNIENCHLLENPEAIGLPVLRSEEEKNARRIFVKRRSDIVDYLKQHFAEWKNYCDYVNNDAVEAEETNQTIKIFRTSGKNLNTFIIDNKKRISIEIPKRDLNLEPNKGLNNRNEHKDKHTDNDIQVHANTFNGVNKTGPKVIRNIKLTDEFEEKVQEKARLDLDVLDYSEAVTLSSLSDKFDSFKDTRVDGERDLNLDVDLSRFNDSVSLVNDNNDTRNASTADSGFGNEANASMFVRNFLTELSKSFKIIYSFVDTFIQDYREDEITEEAKRSIADKASQTHIHIAKVIENLKGIIERESSDSSTLKSLLIKAGGDAVEDKRMTRYRQTVTKCLEQARILEHSLKIMLSAMRDDCDLSVSSENEIGHFNIFE